MNDRTWPLMQQFIVRKGKCSFGLHFCGGLRGSFEARQSMQSGEVCKVVCFGEKRDSGILFGSEVVHFEEKRDSGILFGSEVVHIEEKCDSGIFFGSEVVHIEEKRDSGILFGSKVVHIEEKRDSGILFESQVVCFGEKRRNRLHEPRLVARGESISAVENQRRVQTLMNSVLNSRALCARKYARRGFLIVRETAASGFMNLSQLLYESGQSSS